MHRQLLSIFYLAACVYIGATKPTVDIMYATAFVPLCIYYWFTTSDRCDILVNCIQMLLLYDGPNIYASWMVMFIQWRTLLYILRKAELRMLEVEAVVGKSGVFLDGIHTQKPMRLEPNDPDYIIFQEYIDMRRLHLRPAKADELWRQSDGRDTVLFREWRDIILGLSFTFTTVFFGVYAYHGNAATQVAMYLALLAEFPPLHFLVFNVAYFTPLWVPLWHLYS